MREWDAIWMMIGAEKRKVIEKFRSYEGRFLESKRVRKSTYLQWRK